MSDPTLDLPIRSTFDSRGADAALAALRQLQQAGAAQTRGGSGSGGGAAAGADVSRAANGYMQLQRAQAALEAQEARLARAQGDTTRAAELEASAQQRLTTVIEAQDTATAQTIAAQRQLVGVQQQVAKASQEGATFAQQFGQAMTSSLTSMIGPAVLAGGAIAAIGKTGELVQLGAQAMRARSSFEGLAQAAHTSGDALLAALRSASHGEINDLNLELTANRANLLGVAKDADTLARLMEVARARGQEFGQTTSEAFDKIVTGIGRTSPRILDDLGFIIQEQDAYKVFASSIGTTADALTEAQKKQAILNAILQEGQATMRATGGAADDAASSLSRASASIDNAKAALGGLLALQVAPFADDLSKVANAMAGVGSASEGVKGAGDVFVRIVQQGDIVISSVDKVRGAISSLTGMKLPDFVTQAQGSAAAWEAFANALREGKSVAEAYNAAGEANAAVLFGQGAAARQSAASTMQAAQAAAVHTSSMDMEIQAAVAGGQAIQQQAQATAEAAAQSLIDTQNKAAQTAQTELLNAQTMVAVDAFLQLHPNISAAGVAAMAAAGQIPPLIAQLAQAAIQAREATAALAQFQMQQGLKAATANQTIGFLGNEAEVRNFKRSATADALAQQRKAYQDNARAVAAAKRDQVLTVGTANQQIKQREADLAAAEAQYGKGSAQAIRAETALQQERAQAARGRGRAAGAAKLSDQAKLNNQLFANQEHADQQLEDAEAAHTKKLLDIEKEYQEKSLAQQRENEVAKRASRADFYENLTGATKDLGAQAAQQISAEYEAAYAKAQEIVQAGNQKLAADYLALKQRQLNDEIEYQKKLREAQKNHDKEAVAQLQATHKMRQEANAEEEKQLLDSGDANVKARQDAIDAENQRYDEQTAHITEQADRAADAKVKAAERGGKAVSAENDELQHQLDLLSQIKDKAGQIPTPGGGTGGTDTGGEAPPTDNAAAGGGTFVTRGRTTLTVGDNPGGAELVQVTPLSGKGQTRVGGNMAQMAGGGALVAGGGGPMATASSGGGEGDELATLAHVVAFLSGILPLIKDHNRLLKEVRTYQHTMEETIKVFSEIAALHKALAQPLPPLPPGIFEQLAAELNAAVHAVADQVDPNIHRIRRALEHMLAAEKTAVEIYQQVLALRQALVVPTKPISFAMLHALAAESVQIVQIIRDEIIVANQKQTDELKRYSDLVQASVAALKDIAELHKDLEGAIPALDMRKVETLAAESTRLVQILQQQVIPYSEQDAELLKRYQETTGAAVDVIKGIADLANSLKDPIPAISPTLMQRLADMARLALQIVQARVIPQSQEQTDALKRYQESEGAAVSVLKDIADLSQALKDPMPAITPAMLTRLANVARQATQIVLQRAIPVTQEQADALKRYAETQGAAVEVLKNTLELPARLFVDYQSPSDAQINRVVADANRIARKINDAAKAYDTKGLEAAKAFSDAVGGTFAAFKDGLLFFQALNSGDFALDPKKLAQFEAAMGKTIAMAGRLGAQAAAIGPTGVAALQSTAEALTASYDSMIKLSAVPFGNLPQLTGALGAVGGGSTSITFNNTFMLPAGTTQQMGRQILGQLQQQLRMRQ